MLKIQVITPSKVEESIFTAPALISVISRHDIERYGGNSLFDVLDRGAGLFLYGSYYLPNNMITIRGDATSHYTTHVLMLINGRPFHSSKEGYLLPLLSAFPLDRIERIEIMRGPGSTLYGTTAYSGVINIITRKVQTQKLSVSATVGSFGTSKATLNGDFSINEIDIQFAGTWMDEDGWDLSVRDADGFGVLQAPVNDKAEEQAYSLQTSLEYKNLLVDAYFGSSLINNGYQLQNVHNWPELKLGTDRGMVDIGYKAQLNDNYQVKTNLTYNYQYYWQPFNDSANDDREQATNHDYLLEITQHLKATEKLTVTTGALINYYTGIIENNEQLSDGTSYDVFNNPANPDPFVVVPGYYDVVYSAYLNATYQLNNNLKLITGLHAIKPSYTDIHYSPRLGLVAKINQQWSYKLLYSEAFRSPDNFEVYSTITAILGNQNLQAEIIKTIETELSYQSNATLVTISAFYNQQKNLINRINISTPPAVVSQQFVNQGKIKSWGAESSAKVNLSNHLVIDASLSYHHIELENGIEDPFGVPNLYAKIGIAYQQSTYTLGLFTSHYDYMNEAFGYSVQHPDANHNVNPFTFTSLNLDVDINKLFARNDTALPVSANLYITNLFDQDIAYAEHGRRFVNSTPGRPGIGVYAGLRISF